MTNTRDVIVVGGGVVGATAAYLSAREGLETVLIDRLDPGRATDAGAGIISPRTSTRHDALFELGLRSADYYDTLLEHLAEDGGGETSYARCGDLRVAVTEEELAPFAALVKLLDVRRDRFGPAVSAAIKEISPDEAQALFPPLARPLRALYDRTAARVDGRLLNQALLKAAARRGLETIHASVDRLVLDRGRITGVNAGAHTYDAGHVVIAGGAWSPAFAAALGVPIAVAPQRGQIIHLSVSDQGTAQWPVVHAFRDHYLLAWDGGRVVAGATRETRSGFDARITAAGVHLVLGEALRVAPGLASAGLLETRTGLRPLSEDGLPIAGPVPDIAGAYLATGHGPSGLTLGPYTARLVVDLVLGREPDFDLAPFRVDRFRPRIRA